MKKRLYVFLTVLTLFLFFSCQTSSLPELSLDPLSLLSQDSSIYVGVSVKNHADLTAGVLCAEVPGLSEKDAKNIAQHIDVLYAGLGTVKDRSRLEISSRHTIPSFAVKHAFTKKNGWTQENKTVSSADDETSLFTVYKSNATDLKVSLPDPVTLVCAKNIDSILSRVDFSKKAEENPWNDWIKNPSEDILFYITKPGQYLRNLIGTSVSGVDAVWGTVKYMPEASSSKYSGKYNLSFYLHLKDERAVKAINGFLSLSFAISGGSVKQVDSNTLYLTGVEISNKQIQDLFTRDPITGKHFRVEGENIITEKR